MATAASQGQLTLDLNELIDRIRAMAERWKYTRDDLRYAEADARERPQAWLDLCAWDESLARKAVRAGLRWPS